MTPLFTRSLPLASLACLTLACTPGAVERVEPRQGTADLILHGAAVFTVDPERTWVEAVAIRGDEIVALGSDDAVLARAGTATRIVDVEGAMILPGLQDPHLHVVEAGLNRSLCSLEAGQSLGVYEESMRACAREQADQPWVRAAGPYADDLLAEDTLPIDVLDRAVPDRPALVLDAVGHAVWVNTRALDLLGLDRDSEDPAGGVLDRDPATGRLTGLLLEAAQYLAHDAAEPPTPAHLDRAYDGLLQALAILNRRGYTTVSDAGGYWPRGHHQVWARAEAEGTLTVRASNALFVYPYRDIDAQLRTLTSLFSDRPDRLLRFDHAKLYVDGIPSLGSAAMLEPYEGTRDDHGLLYFDRDLLNRYSRALAAAGFRLHLHATGDRGARLGLDAIILATPGTGPSRHRMTHLYFVHPDDVPRFAAHGIAADFQLGPASSSEGYERFIRPRVGARASRALPLGELLGAGGRVVLSSDWDAEPLRPFAMLARGLTRHRDAIPDLATGIRMMTLDVAHVLGRDHDTGSLEVGKKADLIVVDRNLFELPVSELADARVVLTLLGGETVFAARGWAP